MKILFLGEDRFDYLAGMVLHGLRSMFGADVVDYPRSSPYYIDYPTNKDAPLHGQGFTIGRILPLIDVDRENIKEKIESKFFDVIVYGNVRRNQEFATEVMKVYPFTRVILIDGEDDTHLPPGAHGLYFKRELVNQFYNLFPISFSFPLEKSSIGKFMTKSKEFSDSRPAASLEEITTSNNPHIKDFQYIAVDKTEAEYYADYQKSMLGITMKKAGWDCCRHYEIIFNQCLPWFWDIDNCPPLCLDNWPKELLSKIRHMKGIEYPHINKDVFNQLEYGDYIHQLCLYAQENLTTIKCANYILSKVS